MEVTGPDRISFLHGMLAQDIHNLPEGEARISALTTEKGRLIADLVVYRRQECIGLDVPLAAASSVLAHLGRYVITEEIEFREKSDAVLFTWLGPADVPERTVAAAGGAVLRRRGPPLEGLDIWALEDPEEMRRRLLSSGARQKDSSQWESLRVEAGIPAVGHEITEEYTPAEAGLEEGVSYTKGCFVGQEVIARIHNYGGPQKQLRRLLLEMPGGAPGAGLPPPGSALTDAQTGSEAGRLTSAALSPSGRPVGLAIVFKNFWEAGRKLEVSWEGGRASVQVSPLVR